MGAIWGVAKADFIEHARKFSYIGMVSIALYAAFFFVPTTVAGYTSSIMAIMPGTFFQADNPSWIPITTAWGLGITLPLAGFFYLRNTIIFDENTGVEQLISASPTGCFPYLCGKVISGSLLLYSLIIFTMMGAFLMSLWHFPEQVMPIYAFVSPFLFLFISSVFISAFTVLFASIRLLRNGIGSVIFAFGYFLISDQVVTNQIALNSIILRSFDITGSSIMYSVIQDAVYRESGRPLGTVLFALQVIISGFSPSKSLFFDGMPISNREIISFVLTLVYALILIFIASAAYRLSKREFAPKVAKEYSINNYILGNYNQVEIRPKYFAIPPIEKRAWFSIILMELKLTLKNQPLSWKMLFLLGIVCSIFMDLKFIQITFLPLFMLLSINIFSVMGCREYQHDTLTLISTISNGRLKCIVATWFSGVSLAFFTSLPIIIRMLHVNQLSGVFVVLSGLIFVPSSAIFLGVFTKNNRVFEVFFIIITYASLNNVGVFMYIGIHPEICSPVRAGIYLLCSIALVVSAIFYRIWKN